MNGGPNCWSNTSPKAKKSSMPRASAAARMCGPEHLPELHVHVLGGVDAEPVDAELLDPERVDVDHPFDHLAALGPQVVEAEEVAVQRVLAREAGVAPVVIEQRVVEPGRVLGVLSPGGSTGVYGNERGVDLGERVVGLARVGVVGVVERLPVRVAVGEVALVAIARRCRRVG